MRRPGGYCRRFSWVLLAATAGVPGMAELAAAQLPPSVVRPGAPGAPTRTLSAEDLRAPVQALHSEADVLFMQNMILHHRQALVMSALVPDRTEREDIGYLARRIELSQDSEIAFMKRWLELRGEEAPDPDAEHAHHGAPPDHAAHAHRGHPAGHAEQTGPLMAGMLTNQQLDALADAEGPAFDRTFLELMIIHHEGALEMVSELLASPGAARDSDIFDLASHVYADQRMEIGRMRTMLQASP
ncbi:MAG: DUF305 domain-containing protein [Gemmatimonadales bacterium]|nr:MAG: DUF305 domain-containing protein [Gemmatimonadales bacterium]